MSRAPRSVPSHARRKKVFKQAKGMRGRRKNNITTANAAVDKSLQHNYIGRKEKKRNFRALWIQRINAAVREHGLTYSRFVSGLITAGIEVDRKVLSELAIHEPAAFAAIVEKAKGHLPKAA
jgi:large subunit ribosomal protein L20